MVFDFGALPPEINSARMYTGPGMSPMMAAASAWNGLAAELSETASSCQSVISQLTDEEWRGAASASMAAAVGPYVTWLHTTAEQLQHAASQATASAGAYETAFAMTAPPPVIAANRAQLAALAATNILGQNASAIAATEAQYGEMWARDAAAMYGYAGSSASAGILTPLTLPAPTTDPGGLAAQAAAVSQASAMAASTQSGFSGVIDTLPGAMQSLASPLAGGTPAAGITSAINNFLGNSFVSTTGNGIFDTVAWNMFSAISTAIIYGHAVGAPAASVASGLGAGLGGGGVLTSAAGTAGFAGTPALAEIGSASFVGELSVPAAWSAAAPAGTEAVTSAGSGWTVPTEEGGGITTVPIGMSPVAAAGRGSYGMGPRYGVTPKVMPSQVLV